MSIIENIELSRLIFNANSEKTISLLDGDAISLVFVSDASTYETNISSLITTLMPFKNISIYNLDYTSNKKVLNKYKDTIFGSSKVELPVILIFLNDILYRSIPADRIEKQYISNILKNMYQSFKFNKDFISLKSWEVSYQFHEYSTDYQTSASAAPC